MVYRSDTSCITNLHVQRQENSDKDSFNSQVRAAAFKQYYITATAVRVSTQTGANEDNKFTYN